MLEWSYSGVDFSLYGNGGPECRSYLTPTAIIVETLLIFLYALIIEIIYPWKRSVTNYKPNLELRERFGRKLLLAGLCLIWGIEIGYKLSTRQLIFILNPCHMVTLIQLVLLISPPRNWIHYLFRFQTYLISGATIAIIFPVLNTRHLPFEVASYYIHHGLMLVTPLYLMRLGGIYNMEPLGNFHWGLISIGFMRLYHYLVLQPISFATDVNLNSMMCPAISDPFQGPWYRIVANLHQTFFIFIHGKIFCFIGKHFFAPKKSNSKSIANTDGLSAIGSESDKRSLGEYLDDNGNNINLEDKESKTSTCCSQIGNGSVGECEAYSNAKED